MKQTSPGESLAALLSLERVGEREFSARLE